MFFNYKEFSDWYASKFQRNNPLPWQDGMNAMLYYLSKSVPDNTRVSVAVTNSPTGVTISGKGIENDPYLWAFNFNKSEIEGPQGPQGEQGPQGPQGEPGPGLDDIVSLDITPTFTAGGVAVDQEAGSENIAVDVKYGVDGEIPQIEGVLTLPFKAGDGIIIDVDEDNKRVVFKAAGGSSGGKLYKRTATLKSPANDRVNIIDYVSEQIDYTTFEGIKQQLKALYKYGNQSEYVLNNYMELSIKEEDKDYYYYGWGRINDLGLTFVGVRSTAGLGDFAISGDIVAKRKYINFNNSDYTAWEWFIENVIYQEV
jgi:hypothetical protein